MCTSSTPMGHGNREAVGVAGNMKENSSSVCYLVPVADVHMIFPKFGDPHKAWSITECLYKAFAPQPFKS